VWWRRFHIPWQPLPGYRAAQWYSRQGVEVRRLAEALVAAEGFLVQRGPWSPAQVWRACDKVRVYVMATESWRGFSGQNVAGEQLEEVLCVGPSLAALCHELAHRCEAVIDKRTDYAHAGWSDNGIRAALADFDVWLAARAKASPGVSGLLPVRPLGEDICRHARH
jgi:hypothetical protein